MAKIIINPPSGMDDIATAEFNRILPLIQSEANYCDLDQACLNAYLTWFSIYMQARANLENEGLVVCQQNGRNGPNAHVQILKSASENLHKCIAQLGFSAGARAKLGLKLSSEYAPATGTDAKISALFGPTGS